MRAIRITIAVVIAFTAGACLLISDNSEFMSGGSDVTSNIIGPSIEGQCFGCLVFLCVLFTFITSQTWKLRVICIFLNLLLLLMLTHRIDIDPGRGQIVDFWALAKVQHVDIDPNDGPVPHGEKLIRGALVDEIKKPDGSAAYVFHGIFPLELNLTPLYRLWAP